MRRILITFVLALVAAAPARAQLTEEALLDTLQESAFKFFWSEANPANGLVRDRSQIGSPCSIAATGFGLSAITVGIDRGWITRAEGAERVRRALNFFWGAPQGPEPGDGVRTGYKGLFYHFLNMTTGLRMWTSELSSIDTALLFAGIYDARAYFTGADTVETAIRTYADSITRRADWEWMRNGQAGLMMGWRPAGENPLPGGFTGFGTWRGYNEAMIMYIIALGSPTHPVPASVWNHWTSTYSYNTQYKLTYVLFPPLFGHQYSHCWIDFKGIADSYMRTRGLDYFENSRRATLAQKRYATTNPLARVGYSATLWGLTASDTPTGYNARGAPPTQNDDGTITPTAPLSSIPFAPDSTIPVAWDLWNNYRTGPLWGPYGFRDAFSLTPSPWYDPDYLGIDEGPIVLMIENFRTGAIWKRYKHIPEIHAGLAQAGFLAVVGVDDPVASQENVGFSVESPFHGSTTVRFRLNAAGDVRLDAYDIAGREVARLADGMMSSGDHAVSFAPNGLPSGVYHLRLQAAGRSWVRKCVLVR